MSRHLIAVLVAVVVTGLLWVANERGRPLAATAAVVVLVFAAVTVGVLA